MRLPADEIGHSRRDRLLDDEVVSEARHRTADQDQQRHRQELAAVVVKHLVGAGRTQEIDERADEAQDGDFDQRNDEADRHQCGEIGPDLPAITPVVAEQGRWRHAVIVIAKRIDAGLEETEHGLVSIRNRGQSRIRKRRRTPRRKRRNGRRNARKATTRGAALSRGRLGVRSRSAQQKERVAANACTHSEAERESIADGVQMSSNSKSFRLPQVRAARISQANNPRESAADTRVGSRSQLIKS